MENQSEKNLCWNKLLFLLGVDPEWYVKPETDLYKQITTLGRQIYQQGDKLRAETIDEQQFLTLVHSNYTYNQIAIELNVSKHTLYEWRKEKGYTKQKKMEEVQ